ncbi:Hypothetical protein D9617_24g016670 [Elsinoe fawcettii]|nr:Hypothetical protein D9617_24g016670 [Elsinoe fawcettii]
MPAPQRRPHTSCTWRESLPLSLAPRSDSPSPSPDDDPPPPPHPSLLPPHPLPRTSCPSNIVPFNNPSTQSPHLSSSTTITFLQARKARPTFLMYAITLPLPNPSPSGKTHKVIGLLGAKAFPEIGYSLSPHYQGKGYMTEALRAFLPEMFAAMPTKAQGGWDEVLALVDTDHRASMRLLERTGFKPGEVTKGEYFSKVLGERRDGKAFRLARPGTEGGGTEVVEAQQGEAI